MEICRRSCYKAVKGEGFWLTLFVIEVRYFKGILNFFKDILNDLD